MPRAILSQRRAVLDDVNTIAAYAQDMSEFLNESELTERRAFIETFVKEIVVMPGDALLRYTIPISQSTPKTAVLVGGGTWTKVSGSAQLHMILLAGSTRASGSIACWEVQVQAHWLMIVGSP